MFKDYSGSCLMVTGGNKIRSPRRKSFAARELLPAARLLWKTVGAVLLATLVIGISSTIWYGLQIQVALDQILGLARGIICRGTTHINRPEFGLGLL